MLTRWSDWYAISLVFAVVSSSLAEAAEKQEQRSRATRSTTEPARGGSTDQGLVKNLVKPYWFETERSWQRWFDRAQRGRFDLKQRDVAFSQLADRLKEMRAEDRPKVLSIELISGEHWVEYERRVFFAGDARAIPELAALGGKRIDQKEWAELEALLKVMLKQGGGNNGVRFLADSRDATVISFFDGRDWQIETWFCLSELLAYKDRFGVPRPERMAPDFLAFHKILKLIKTRVDKGSDFGSRYIIDLEEYLTEATTKRAG